MLLPVEIKVHKVPSEPYKELVKLSAGASHLEFN